jgi:hypothetical protein
MNDAGNSNHGVGAVEKLASAKMTAATVMQLVQRPVGTEHREKIAS